MPVSSSPFTTKSSQYPIPKYPSSTRTFFPLSITHVQIGTVMALYILTYSVSNSIKRDKKILDRRITNINEIYSALISWRMPLGFVADIPKYLNAATLWRTIVTATHNLVKEHEHIFIYLCAYVYKSSASDRDSVSFFIFTFLLETDLQSSSLLLPLRVSFLSLGSRGGFTMKLKKIKLRGSWLARAPSKALGGVLNKYPLSYLICINFLKEGPQNCICFRPLKTWIRPC